MAQPKKVNYLNNKDILKEIHKSKMTYCWLAGENYGFFDIILDDVKNGYISIISAEREYGILINDDDTYEEKEERLEYRKKAHNN